MMNLNLKVYKVVDLAKKYIHNFLKKIIIFISYFARSLHTSIIGLHLIRWLQSLHYNQRTN
jgi:hypothetical protein